MRQDIKKFWEEESLNNIKPDTGNEFPEGWDVTKTLYFAKKAGVLVIDSFNEGTKGQSTGRLAGAVGNIIDCAFYGILFSESTYSTVAEFLPEEGGYASFLHGKVVDMLYFPVIHTRFPEWFPIWGGQSFVFFRPIFNLADSSISVGVATILIFQKRLFKEQ